MSIETDIPTPATNNQLIYLWNDGDLKYRFLDSIRWTIFPKSFDLYTQFTDKLSSVLNSSINNSNDSFIYSAMNEYFVKYIMSDPKFLPSLLSSHKEKTQGNFIADLAAKYYKNKIINYLDIGGGDCKIAKKIADILHIDYSNTYVTELLPKDLNCNEINYIQVSSDNFPNEFTNKFQLITCLMTLHHLNFDVIIGEIYKALTLNGLLIIREHDAFNKKLNVFLDVLHGFHLMVLQSQKEIFQNYKAYYHSAKFWKNLLESKGFKQVFFIKREGNTGEKYHAVYKKIPLTGGSDSVTVSIPVPDTDFTVKVQMPPSALIKGPMDYPKDSVAKNLIPEEITECSIISGKNGVCSSDNVVKAIGKIIGTSNTNNKTIIEEAKQKLQCNDERCVLNKNIIKNRLGNNIVKKELTTNFKLIGPTDVTLLNNENLDNILIQFSHKFHDFYPNNFNMVNYENVGDTLQSIDMKDDVYDKNYRTFGCIINSDTYSGKGKHWMALFADMRDSNLWTAEFFNSSGNPPVEAWTNWMRKTVNRFADINSAYNLGIKEFKQVRVSRIRHQESQTECGVYALFYIWGRLNGVPYTYFENNIIPDKWMFEMRQHLFRDPYKEPMKEFKFEDFSRDVRVKWEI